MRTLVLRHQLQVALRTNPTPRLRNPDRILWVWLRQLWPAWREHLLIVRPETVIRWHPKGWCIYWSWKAEPCWEAWTTSTHALAELGSTFAPLQPLNVDLDVVLSGPGGGRLRRPQTTPARLCHRHPHTLQRRFLSTGGHILHRDREIIIRLDRRTYSPILRQADIEVTEVPRWGGRRLRFEFA